MCRRMTYAALSVVALVSLAVHSVAQTTIPLPQLTGIYDTGVFLPNDGPSRREVTFVLPSSIQAIDEMRLVLSGNAREGLMVRPSLFGGPPDSTAFMHGSSLYLRSAAIPDETFHATIRTPPGRFGEISAVFVCSGLPGHVDPGALLGAEIHGELFTDFVIGGWWELFADSIVDLTVVRIEVTGPVREEMTSWGAVQALYR